MYVPQLSSIDPLWTRHPVVADEFIKLARGYAEVHRGLDAREAAARDRPDGGKGGYPPFFLKAITVALG